MAITILEGSNFCISDQNGDFTFLTSGLYAYDMRFLSHLELTINGERPLLRLEARAGLRRGTEGGAVVADRG